MVRYNPPPNWPAPPAGWTPPPGWGPPEPWPAPPQGWDLWVEDRSWLARNKVWVIVGTLFVLFLAVPLVSALASSSGPSEAEAAIGATAPLSQSDEEILEHISEHSAAWNEAAEPFVSTYLDPNVSADAWVAGSSDSIEGMRAALVGFEREVLRIQDDGVRARFEAMVANYHRKMDASVSLWNAVAALDVDAETAAATELDAAATEGQRLATELLDDVRPYMD